MKSYTVFLNNSVHTREMLIVIILFALTPHWLTINCQKNLQQRVSSDKKFSFICNTFEKSANMSAKSKLTFFPLCILFILNLSCESTENRIEYFLSERMKETEAVQNLRRFRKLKFESG